MKRLMVFLMTVLAALPVSRAEAATVDEEIEQLLNYVRTSQVMFVRNGQEHKPAEAADHMAKKRDHFKNQITTAEDFIRLAATQSLVSGEPYLIKSPDGKTEKTAEWLSRELERFRNEKKPGGQSAQ